MELPDLMGDLNFAMSANTVNACNNEKRKLKMFIANQKPSINSYNLGLSRKKGKERL